MDREAEKFVKLWLVGNDTYPRHDRTHGIDNPLYKVTLDTTQEATIEVPDGFYTVEVLSGLVPETVRYLDGVVGIDELIVVGSASGAIGGTGSSGTVIIPMGAPVPLGTPAGTLIIRTP